MGQVITPKYAIEFFGFQGFRQTPMGQRRRLTVAQLEQMVMEQVVSTYPGFVNEHLGKAYGIQIPSRVVLRENKAGGRVISEWKAPTFMVLPEAANYPKVAKSVSV